MRELQRILHVDDDDDIRAIAAMALELIGLFELLQCTSGQQATEQAASFRSGPAASGLHDARHGW